MSSSQSDGVASGRVHSYEVFHIISVQDENTAVMNFAAWFGRWFRLCTADVLADEFLVAESCFLLLGAIFADAFGCKSGPAGEKTTVNCVDPC